MTTHRNFPNFYGCLDSFEVGKGIKRNEIKTSFEDISFIFLCESLGMDEMVI